MINVELPAESSTILIPDCQIAIKESDQIEIKELCQCNSESIEPLLDSHTVVETSEEEYHSLSSNSSFHIENVPRTKDARNLFKCGSFVPKTGAKAYKTPKLNYTAFFSSQSVFEAMKVRSVLPEKTSNQEYLQLRQTYVEWIFELAEKLKVSDNSSHLAVLLLDALYLKDSSNNSRLQLFAPVCLLLAAKTIELDERIPFATRLRRAANPGFSLDDYRKAEITLLEALDWNPQFTSVLEFLEFFLSQGSVYSSDSLLKENENTEVLRENIQLENKPAAKEEGLVNREAFEKPRNSHSACPEQEQRDTNASSPNTLDGSTPENDENNFDHGDQPVNYQQDKKSQVESENAADLTKNNDAAKKKHSLIRTYVTTKLTSISDPEILQLASKVEKDCSKLSYLVVRESEFTQVKPVILASACLAFLRKLHKIEPAWNDELAELTKIEFAEISNYVNLIESKIDTARLVSQLSSVQYAPSVALSSRIGEILKDIPSQESSRFVNLNTAAKLAAEGNLQRPDQPFESNIQQVADPAPLLNNEQLVPLNPEFPKYDRSKVSSTSYSSYLSNPSYQNLSSQPNQEYKRQYNYHATSYYPSQYSYQSRASYHENEQKDRGTVDQQSTEISSYKPGRSMTAHLSSGTSYTKYNPISIETRYQPTSSYLSSLNISAATTTNAGHGYQYGSYLRSNNVYSLKNSGPELMSARLNASVDSGLGLQARLGSNKK